MGSSSTEYHIYSTAWASQRHGGSCTPPSVLRARITRAQAGRQHCSKAAPEAGHAPHNRAPWRMFLRRRQWGCANRQEERAWMEAGMWRRGRNAWRRWGDRRLGSPSKCKQESFLRPALPDGHQLLPMPGVTFKRWLVSWSYLVQPEGIREQTGLAALEAACQQGRLATAGDESIAASSNGVRPINDICPWGASVQHL